MSYPKGTKSFRKRIDFNQPPALAEFSVAARIRLPLPKQIGLPAVIVSDPGTMHFSEIKFDFLRRENIQSLVSLKLEENGSLQKRMLDAIANKV